MKPEEHCQVYYIETFKQWIVRYPDSGGYHNYYRRQMDAWNVARKYARKHRAIALVYFKCGRGIRFMVDYRTQNEKVQAAERSKHLYP